MDLSDVARDIGDSLRRGDAVVAAGAGTHVEVGNPVVGARVVRVPSGVVVHEPADLTVRAWAGTPVDELQAVLATAGQEVAIEARDGRSTIGGVLACGFSGFRRLRDGPVRDAVLQVDAVDGRGVLFKGGGPTVKNVTGYDLPRLLVGSLGTLAVLLQVTLRCRPRPAARRWYRCPARAPDAAGALRTALLRPSSLLWDGAMLSVQLEGHPGDLADEASRAGLEAAPPEGPPHPDGAHRGRIAVDPARLAPLAERLRAAGTGAWIAEVGVGTVHVASHSAAGLLAARECAHAEGGWLLREAGGDGCDGFGIPLPNAALLARVKAAFDPQRLLAPGRLPL